MTDKPSQMGTHQTAPAVAGDTTHDSCLRDASDPQNGISNGQSVACAYPGRERSMESLRHFLSPYYIVNTMLLLAYIPVRCHWDQHGLSNYSRLEDMDDIFKWESQCSGMISFVLAIKSLRQQLTMDMILADTFLYFKAGLLTVTFMVDPRVCTYFGIAFLLAYLMAPQPYRDCLGSHNTELLNLSSFQDKITHGLPGTKWLVLFFMPGKVGRQVNIVFASLSLAYASNQLHFGRVNVQSSPDLAHSQGVQAKTSFHGASIVMYSDAKEVCQHPTGATTDPAAMSADTIAKVFDLDKVHNRQSTLGRIADNTEANQA